MNTRHWYVVYSKPRKEQLAQFHLELRGLETFFPRLLLPQPLPRHRRIVPLFPNYLFVRIHLEENHQVIWSPGVKRLISFNGTPSPIDEGIVAFLRQQATAEGILRARSSLREGQEVQIIGGPFAGLSGIIQNPPDTRGRVWVLMELLGRQARVELAVGLVKSEWVLADGEEGYKIAPPGN